MKNKLLFKPWFTIWFNPQKTIAQIIERNVNKDLLILSALAGFSYGPLTSFANQLTLQLQVASLEGIAKSLLFYTLYFLFMVFFGYLFVNFTTLVLFWTGKWIQGKGTFKEIRASMFWSHIPYYIGFVVISLAALLYLEEGHVQNIGLFNAGFSFILIISQIWSVVLLVKTISKVQGFSILKAIINIFLSIALFCFISLSIFLFTAH